MNPFTGALFITKRTRSWNPSNYMISLRYTPLAASTTTMFMNSGAVPLWVPLSDLQAFYLMERVLFSRLVLQMRMNPLESMRIIALWLLLEEDGRASVIRRLLPLSAQLLTSAVLEAEACLTVVLPDVVAESLPSARRVEFTASIMGGDWFTLSLIGERKDALRNGITYYVERVFPSLFSDILYKAAALREAMALMDHNDQGRRPGPSDLVEALMSRLSLSDQQEYHTGNTSTAPELPPSSTPITDSDRRSTVETPATPIPSSTNYHEKSAVMSSQEPEIFRSSLNPSAIPWYPGKRTLFLTFSKGYPLSETDIIRFFTRRFGDCVESLRLQRTPRGNQPLFATLVLKSEDMVQVVLMGQDRVRYRIRGKHVIARLYVPKSSPSSFSSSSGSQQRVRNERTSHARPQRELKRLPSRGTAATSSSSTWRTDMQSSPSSPSSLQVPASTTWSTIGVPSSSFLQVSSRTTWPSDILSSSTMQIPARTTWGTGMPSSSSLQIPARDDRAGSSSHEANYQYKAGLDGREWEFSSFNMRR